MEVKLTINQTIRSFSVVEDTSLSRAINLVFPSIKIIPAEKDNVHPLWVLINNESIANANITSILSIPNTSIISIEYALQQSYFHMLQQHLKTFGVCLNFENVSLLVFMLHLWLQHFSYINIEQQILSLLQHYPEYISQPIQLFHAYNYAKSQIATLQMQYNNYLNSTI